MKKIILSFIISLSATSLIYGNFTGSDFLLINNSAERYTTGGAGAAKYSDISFSPYNPAAPGKNRMVQISLSHLILNNNLNFEYIGIGGPFLYTTLSLHLVYLYYPNNFESIGGENTDISINYSDMAVILSEAVPIKKFITLGLNVKFIKREIAGVKTTGYAIDFGAIKNFYFFNFDKNIDNNFGIGFSIKNIGSQLKFLQESESLPLTFTAGIKYSPYKVFTFLYDFNKSLSRTPIHNIGIEYNTKFHITPGVGIEIGEEINFTGGIGLNYQMGHLKFKANYSVNIFGSMIKNHNISLNIKIQ